MRGVDHLAGQIDDEVAGVALARLQLRQDEATELQALLLVGGRVAADHDQALHAKLGRRQNLDRGFGFGCEIGGGGGGGQNAAGARVEVGERAAALQFGAGDDRGRAPERGREGGEVDVEVVGHRVCSGMGLSRRWRGNGDDVA